VDDRKGAQDVLDMRELSLVWQLTTAWIADRRRRLAEQPSDRGADLLVLVIVTAALAAAALVIVGILVSKATNAANGVQTE
jgi:hypothetical protein